MVSLPDGEKISKICLFVLTWSTNVMDRQMDRRTDTAWQQRPRLCIASRGKMKKRRRSSHLLLVVFDLPCNGLFRFFFFVLFVFYCCCLWWRIKLCVSSRKQSGLTCGLTCIRPVHCHHISNLFLVNNQSNKADKARLQFVRHNTSTAVSCYAP